ncbi:unnamed protein product [Linum tenue]|uniref:Uncharacterized protein n=2 Tax=Linum tenue TaxID=586396 RepID=A0AAV0L449_9ROSI|nr:unnamed protein product [Linum tenue]
MAQIIVSSIAGTLLSVLQDKLFDEVAAIPRLELRQLQDTVSTIEAVLLDAEQRQVHDNSVKQWLERLSLVLYDADDVFDDYSTEAARRRTATAKEGPRQEVNCVSWVTSILPPLLGQFLYARKVNRDIKAIREKLDDISKDREELELEARTPADEYALLPSLRETDSGSTAVVGRGDDIAKLTGVLLNYESGKSISVISVVGMPGIGKTALAQLLFNDEIIKQHFELRVWVSLSDNFHVGWIVRRIVESTTDQRIEMLEMNELVHMLQRSIGARRYLLVLDDVHNQDSGLWGSLLDLLKLGGAGSKVLVTARSEQVATAARSKMHKLLGLSPEASWNLFSQVVFDGEEQRDARVRELGWGIVEKCHGNPLLIKTLGGSLAGKDPKTEWPSTADDKILGEGHQTDDDMYSALRLIYQQLPSYLKLCFEYCSLFPKDSEIEVQTLIHLWIAHGLIKCPQVQQDNIEDVAYGHFLELLRRFFVEEGEKDDFGKVRTFQINNLMHSLAKTVAGTKNSTVRRNEDQNEQISKEVRHLTFSCHLDASIELPAGVIRAKSLRTVFLANQELRSSNRIRRGRSILKDFCSSLERLRALDVHNSGIEQVPASIRNMKSLRYLDLSENDDIKLLPDSITDLWNLQVLKISGCERLKQLPISIGRLVNLRHLYCEGCWNMTHMPRSIGELTSLITLTWFVLPKDLSASHFLTVGLTKLGRVDPRAAELSKLVMNHTAAGLNELGRLNQLKGRLEIRNLGAYMKNANRSELESTSFFRAKKGLQSLSLCWDPNLDEKASIFDVDDQHHWSLKCLEPPPQLTELQLCEYGGHEFPAWISSLKNLISLQVQDCQNFRSLPALEDFPLLKFCRLESLPQLEFMDNNCSRVEGHSSSLFQSLKKLYIFKCPKLRGWWKEGIEDGAIISSQFHGLSTLEIRDCPKLDQMPLFPSLDEKLLLENASLVPLRQTMQIQEAAIARPSSSSTPLPHPLSKLKSIWISSIEEQQVLPEDWLQELISLQELRIDCWTSLAFLPPGMSRLTNLRELDIRRCPQLKQRCAGNKAADWSNVSHISNIKIDKKTIQLGGIYQLCDEESAALIANFSLVHPLSRISSVTIEDLEYLPSEWLQTLATLKKLKIVNCPSLECRPQELHYLTSLQRLQIKQRN